MGEKRTGGQEEEPTLELPSLFGRRKRRRAAEAPEPEAPATEAPATEAPATEAPATEAPAGAPEPATEEEEATPAPAQGTRKAARTGPLLPPRPSAALTGLVVGAGGTGLTYLSLRGCEAVQGTESCGGPGLLLLVGIGAVMVIGGGLLLKAFGLSDPTGTSFLAVGLTVVAVMVTLMEDLFSPWMFVAVPLISMAAYGLSQWVTTRFVDTVEDGPGVDVR